MKKNQYPIPTACDGKHSPHYCPADPFTTQRGFRLREQSIYISTGPLAQLDMIHEGILDHISVNFLRAADDAPANVPCVICAFKTEGTTEKSSLCFGFRARLPHTFKGRDLPEYGFAIFSNTLKPQEVAAAIEAETGVPSQTFFRTPHTLTVDSGDIRRRLPCVLED